MQAILDEDKRQTLINLLASGSSRRVASRYVGCAPSTITRTANRSPEFAEQVVRAEQMAEITLLKQIQAAAQVDRYWRAAAWLLERRNPEDFAARQPHLFTLQQVADILAQFVEIIRGDLPPENCRSAVQKLETLLEEFQTADAPVSLAVETEPSGPQAPGQPETVGS